MTDDSRRFNFPRALRLTSRRDFADTYAAQVRRTAGPLLVFARPNQLGHARIGLSVGRKVGNAPRRARIKRLLREAFRLERHEMAGSYDLIIVVRRHEPLALAEYRSLLGQVVGKLDRAWHKHGSRLGSGPPPESPPPSPELS